MFGVLFFLAAGGPYGLEEIVPTAGPGLAVLVLLAMGFFWAVPYALIVAELVSAIPEQGGGYRWYRAYLGPFWSFQFACLDWVSWALDAALYPPLVAAYLLRFLAPDASHFVSWLVGLVVIWGCTWINVRGVDLVGRLTSVLTVVVLASIGAFVVLGWSSISLDTLSPMVPDGKSFHEALNFALVFCVWSYSGYGGLAYASEEVVHPERNYPRVLAVLVPLTILIYVLPLLVTLGATPDWETWQTAQFDVAALVVGGAGLAVLMSVGAQLANIGLFSSELMVTSRLPYAMAKDGLLPEVFTQLHPRYGTPSRFLVLQAILYSVLTWFLDFTQILLVSTWISLPSYMLMFVTPMILRVRRPDLRGPFRIRGGWPVLALCAGVPNAVCVYVLVTMGVEEMLMGLVFLVIPPALYLWSRYSIGNPAK